MTTPRTLIMYHGNCPDGFGGAYAAWKKFGDAAEYIPLSRDVEAPMDVEGAHLYFIDFCYPIEIMEQYIAKAEAVTVLDHHAGVANVVTKMPEYRYETDHSGAVIAWKYFHPDSPIPLLLQYIEQGDLYTTNLPDTEALLSFIYTRPQHFLEWETLQGQVEDAMERGHLVTRGQSFAEHKRIIVEQIANLAEVVEFEGYTCYLGTCSKQFTSPVGHLLAERMPSIALVASVHTWGIRVSLRRSDDSVDLAELAQRFGGNGHPFAAAFSLKWTDEIPWKAV